MAIEKKKVIDIDTKNAQNNVKTLKQEIKELRDAMGQMEKGSKEWEEASVKLANAQQKQTEIAEAGKFANKDFGQTLSNIGAVGAGVAAGINGLTSALSLMGVEVAKDDVGMIKFTQSMMAIVQALSSIDTATKAWKGLMTSLNAMLDQKIADTAATAANTTATEANTAAANANAAAKGKQAAAVGENAAAMGTEAATSAAATKSVGGLSGVFTKLAAALKMSKAALGVWALAITAAITAIVLLTKKNREAIKEQKEWKSLMKESNTAARQATQMLEQYNETLHNSNASYEDRLAALQQLKSAFPEYEGQLTTEGKLLNDNNEYLKANIEYLKQKAIYETFNKKYLEYLDKIAEQEQKIKDIADNKTTGSGFWDFFDVTVPELFGFEPAEWDIKFTNWVRGSKNIAEKELEDFQRQANKHFEAMQEASRKMAIELTAITAGSSFKNQNTQILQFKASVESTTRSLAQLYATFSNQMEEFKTGGTYVFQSFINQVENALKGAGLDAGDVFGEGVWDGFKTALKLGGNSNFESGMEDLTKKINKAVEESEGDISKFFSLLQASFYESLEIVDESGNKITEIVGNIPKVLREKYLEARNGILTVWDADVHDFSPKSIFNPDFIDELQKKLLNLQKRYAALGNSVSTISEEAAKRNQETVNNWERDYEEQWQKLKKYTDAVENAKAKLWEAQNAYNSQKSAILNSSYDSNTKAIKLQQLDYSLLAIQIGKYTKELSDAQAALDKYKTDNAGILDGIDEQREAFIHASDALSQYNIQLGIANDRNARFGMTREQLEGEISAIQAIIDAYNKLSSTQKSMLLEQYEIYRSIVPEMSRRLKIEQEYQEARKKGDLRAQERKNLSILEMEKEELEERMSLQKRILKQMSDDLAAGKHVDYETIKKVNQEITQLMTDLANKQIDIDNEMYDQRTSEFERYWETVENDTEKKYNELEQLMLEHKNLWNLGSDDYNAQLDELETQRHFLDEKLMSLELYHKQGLMNEIDYQEQLKAINQEYADLDVQINQEKSNRKLKIFNTYYNGIKSITSAINGILSQAIEAEEGNKEKQKELRIAQTWMTGVMGSIEALVSGIQSGIPAPGNFILGGVLSAATLTETAMAVANIRKESGSTTSGAANINVPTYETLSYENDVDLTENVRDQRVFVVESDVQSVGMHIDTIESEAQF